LSVTTTSRAKPRFLSSLRVSLSAAASSRRRCTSRSRTSPSSSTAPQPELPAYYRNNHLGNSPPSWRLDIMGQRLASSRIHAAQPAMIRLSDIGGCALDCRPGAARRPEASIGTIMLIGFAGLPFFRLSVDGEMRRRALGPSLRGSRFPWIVSSPRARRLLHDHVYGQVQMPHDMIGGEIGHQFVALVVAFPPVKTERTR
jgi:hypothetical protein